MESSTGKKPSKQKMPTGQILGILPEQPEQPLSIWWVFSLTKSAQPLVPGTEVLYRLFRLASVDGSEIRRENHLGWC